LESSKNNNGEVYKKMTVTGQNQQFFILNLMHNFLNSPNYLKGWLKEDRLPGLMNGWKYFWRS